MRVVEFAVSKVIKRLVHMSTEAVCSSDMISSDMTITESAKLGDISQCPQLPYCIFTNGEYY
jgi:hypothetical protein